MTTHFWLKNETENMVYIANRDQTGYFILGMHQGETDPERITEGLRRHQIPVQEVTALPTLNSPETSN